VALSQANAFTSGSEKIFSLPLATNDVWVGAIDIDGNPGRRLGRRPASPPAIKTGEKWR
jgi:hypothetical protein